MPCLCECLLVFVSDCGHCLFFVQCFVFAFCSEQSLDCQALIHASAWKPAAYYQWFLFLCRLLGLVKDIVRPCLSGWPFQNLCARYVRAMCGLCADRSCAQTLVIWAACGLRARNPSVTFWGCSYLSFCECHVIQVSHFVCTLGTLHMHFAGTSMLHSCTGLTRTRGVHCLALLLLVVLFADVGSTFLVAWHHVAGSQW